MITLLLVIVIHFLLTVCGEYEKWGPMMVINNDNTSNDAEYDELMDDLKNHDRMYASMNELNAVISQSNMRAPDVSKAGAYGSWHYDWNGGVNDSNNELIMVEVRVNHDGSFNYCECWNDRTINHNNVDIAYIINSLTCIGFKNE